MPFPSQLWDWACETETLNNKDSVANKNKNLFFILLNI